MRVCCANLNSSNRSIYIYYKGLLFCKGVSKIGYYVRNLKMALQTAEILVQYGLRTEWEEAFDYDTNQGESQTHDNLPRDPRQWSRENVADWLKFVTTEHNLPEVESTRFLMNGKALCLMSPGMFLKRAPLGGKLLYKDFQLRLSAALYASN